MTIPSATANRIPGFWFRALCPAIVVLACASGGSGSPDATTQRSPYVTETCPLPAGMVGYPLTVVALDDAPVDSAWLAAWSRAAAYRWQVPSHRRPVFTGFRRVTSRVLPDAPRWADDWTPQAKHRAELVVTVDRAGATISEMPVLSGDELFDRSLRSIIDDPLPASPPLPTLPSSAMTPVRLMVRFGVEHGPESILRFGGDPEPVKHAVTRFARQQAPVRVAPGSFTLTGLTGTYAIVKYDVEAEGWMTTGSFQSLEASDDSFARAVEQALYRSRFIPAQGDCAPIRLTVVQSFGR